MGRASGRMAGAAPLDQQVQGTAANAVLAQNAAATVEDALKPLAQ